MHPHGTVSFLTAFALLICSTSGEEVSFRRDIAPIFQQRCAACHGEETSKGAYRLDNFAHLQKTGDSELPPLVPGKPEESELYRLLVEPSPGDRMPQKADALPAGEIAIVKKWIEQGASYDGESPEQNLAELAREVHLRAAPEFYPARLPITALAFSHDGRQLAISGYYEVLIWDLELGRVVRRINRVPERITSLAWHRTGMLAVAGGSPSQWGTVALVPSGESAPARYLCDLPETTLSVAFRPDGKHLVVGSGDRTMRFFDTETGKEIRVLRHHSDWVQQVSYDPAGEQVLSASRDRTAKLVNAETGEVETTFADHDAVITAASFLSSRLIISMDLARKVHVWDRKSGKRKVGWTSANDAKNGLALWSGYAVVAGGTKTPELRDTSEGTIVRSLMGHRAAVQTLAVSPNGELLATGSLGGEVLIWKAGCETYLQRIHPAPVVVGKAVTAR